jgi:hypothetical protein
VNLKGLALGVVQNGWPKESGDKEYPTLMPAFRKIDYIPMELC